MQRTYLAERDVPLQLEGELFVLAGRLVLGADEDVVEEEQVAQLPLALGQLDDERVLDEMPLRTVELREDCLGVLHVVLVHEVLRRVERLRQRRKVLAVVGRVLDQVLRERKRNILKEFF